MNWAIANSELILDLALTHISLCVLPIILSFVLSIPIGWFANRRPWARSVIISGGSLLYTIPSLPLFVMLPYILGTRITDPINIVVALTLYAIAMMVRSASDALAAVPADAINAATAMGYSRWGRFWRVELPLAGPVLLAGARVVSVSTIALASVGAIIGSANLGYLFTNGKQRDFLDEILIGIVATLVIALVFDVILVLVGRVLMPWNTAKRARPRAKAVV